MWTTSLTWGQWLLAFQKWGDSVRKYAVRNCGSRFDTVRYEELKLRPDPLMFPGSVYVNSLIKVVRDIEEPIKVSFIKVVSSLLRKRRSLNSTIPARLLFTLIFWFSNCFSNPFPSLTVNELKRGALLLNV